MHEDWVMCASVPLGEAKLFVEECVDPMFVDAPVEWSARGMHRNPVQSALAPSRPPAPQSGHDPGAIWPFHRHVEVAAH